MAQSATLDVGGSLPVLVVPELPEMLSRHHAPLLFASLLALTHCGGGDAGAGAGAGGNASFASGGMGAASLGGSGALGAGTGGANGALVGGSPASGGQSIIGGATAGGSMSSGGAATGGMPGSGGMPTGGVPSTGGAVTGGVPSTGGAVTGGVPSTGGAVTGGVPSTGGAATGGVPSTGGTATGGTATGGTATGGTATGGTATGGTATGGAATGGTATGGTATGGAATGGTATGGTATGGSSSTGGAESTYEPCPTDGTACKIMPFGDSITDGFNADTPGGYRVELFRRAVEAGKNITFVGTNWNGPDTVAGVAFPHNHEGYSGWLIDPPMDTTSWRGGISSLVDSIMPTFTPHIVLLMIGTNDAGLDEDMPNAPTRLGNLIDSIYAELPDVLLVVAQLIPSRGDTSQGDDGELTSRIITYNEGIPAVVAARANAGRHILLVDMFTPFSPKESLLEDQWHPNLDGYVILGTQWYSAIESYLN